MAAPGAQAQGQNPAYRSTRPSPTPANSPGDGTSHDPAEGPLVLRHPVPGTSNAKVGLSHHHGSPIVHHGDRFVRSSPAGRPTSAAQGRGAGFGRDAVRIAATADEA